MSNEYTCDDCGFAREVTEDEVEFGTHYCNLKKEFVECYINCKDYISKEEMLYVNKKVTKGN